MLCRTAITTSRTVTFILQSNKSAIPDFDSWYATYQQRFGEDPVMRWAKNARPGTVYGQFALMIVDLHRHCGVIIPEERLDLGEPLLRNLLEDGRTRSMEPLEDREVYISVRDRSVLGYRKELRHSDQTGLKKAAKRYGANLNLRGLRDATTLLQVARLYFSCAQTIMLRDGNHVSMFFPLKGMMPIDLIVAPPKDRTDKYMLMRDVARHVHRIGADGLLHIAEAWVANLEDVPRGRFADSARNRREAIVLMAVNARGEQISFVAEIERKMLKRHKVKRFRPTEVNEHDKLMAMAPVLEVWGRLDALRLDERDDLDTWAEKHFSTTNPEKV